MRGTQQSNTRKNGSVRGIKIRSSPSSQVIDLSMAFSKHNEYKAFLEKQKNIVKSYRSKPNTGSQRVRDNHLNKTQQVGKMAQSRKSSTKHQGIGNSTFMHKGKPAKFGSAKTSVQSPKNMKISSPKNFSKKNVPIKAMIETDKLNLTQHMIKSGGWASNQDKNLRNSSNLQPSKTQQEHSPPSKEGSKQEEQVANVHQTYDIRMKKGGTNIISSGNLPKDKRQVNNQQYLEVIQQVKKDDSKSRKQSLYHGGRRKTASGHQRMKSDEPRDKLRTKGQAKRKKLLSRGDYYQQDYKPAEDKVEKHAERYAKQQIEEREPNEPYKTSDHYHHHQSEEDTFSNKSSLQDFIIGKQIGQGAYAVVRIGLHKPSNKKVALKIYDKTRLLEPQRRKSVKREIRLMEKMRHCHIVKLYEVIETEKSVILVMEYVGGGSLHGYLKAQPHRRLPEDEVRRLFKQIISALQYLHSKCITHRDIKLENILLDHNGNVKFIDFGFSTCIPNERKIKIFCGTPSYMAPEIVTKKEYAGPPADIWALGVLMYALLCGCFPYRGATDKELYTRICSCTCHLPEYLSEGVINLFSKLYSYDADSRPTAYELQFEPWVNPSLQSNRIRSLSTKPKDGQTSNQSNIPTQSDQSKQSSQRFKNLQIMDASSEVQQYQISSRSPPKMQQQIVSKSNKILTDNQHGRNCETQFGQQPNTTKAQDTHMPDLNKFQEASPPLNKGKKISFEKGKVMNPSSAHQRKGSMLNRAAQKRLESQVITFHQNLKFNQNNQESQPKKDDSNRSNQKLEISLNLKLTTDDRDPNAQTQKALLAQQLQELNKDMCNTPSRQTMGNPNYAKRNDERFMPITQTNQEEGEELDPDVVQSIVKLGYTVDEIVQQIKDQNSFMVNLYIRLFDEKKKMMKTVQPTFIPSIVSSLVNSPQNSTAGRNNYASPSQSPERTGLSHKNSSLPRPMIQSSNVNSSFNTGQYHNARMHMRNKTGSSEDPLTPINQQ